jgi:hypothetical protein
MQSLNAEMMALPTVQKICRLGYVVKYEFHKLLPNLSIYVYQDGLPVATACFQFDKPSRMQFTETIDVYAGHRRKGIANALMVCSIHLTGCKPKPASGQTNDGRAWWEQPNRPW